MAKIIKRKAVTTLHLSYKDKADVEQVLDQSFSNVNNITFDFSPNGNIFVKFTHDVEIDTNI